MFGAATAEVAAWAKMGRGYHGSAHVSVPCWGAWSTDQCRQRYLCHEGFERKSTATRIQRTGRVLPLYSPGPVC